MICYISPTPTRVARFVAGCDGGRESSLDFDVGLTLLTFTCCNDRDIVANSGCSKMDNRLANLLLFIS